jgi:hypothetical protein
MMWIDGMDLPARRGTLCEFVPDLDGFHYEARLLDSGSEPNRVLLRTFGAEEILSRVEDCPTTKAEALVGRYCCVSGGIVAEFSLTEGNVFMKTTGRFGQARFKLESVADGLWRTIPVGQQAVLVGTIDVCTDFASFTYTSSRTRQLTFRRLD